MRPITSHFLIWMHQRIFASNNLWHRYGRLFIGRDTRKMVAGNVIPDDFIYSTKTHRYRDRVSNLRTLNLFQNSYRRIAKGRLFEFS